jgi:hypothetical protein
MVSFNRIQWLPQELGISVRVLAKFFNVSHTLIHLASQGKRNLPARKQEYLNDPLFDPLRHPVGTEGHGAVGLGG